MTPDGSASITLTATNRTDGIATYFISSRPTHSPASPTTSDSGPAPNGAVNELAHPGDELDTGGLGDKYCLNVPDNDSRPGVDLQMWSCNDSDAQTFIFAQDRIMHHSGLCVGVDGDFANGRDVELQNCVDDDSQTWTARAEPSSDDDVRIRWYKFEVGPGYCLDRRDGHERGVTNGMAVQIWSCNGRSDNKDWH